VAAGRLPAKILSLPYRPGLVIRGLVVDRRRGNLLKMDYFNYISRAYHGERALSAEERKHDYRHRRVRISADSYVSIDTLFHLPEAYLYQLLVDQLDAAGRGSSHTYWELYGMIRSAIDEAHADGTIKKVIMADRDRYLRPDAQLGTVLEKLRESGKKLFLLTNSEFYYTDALLSVLLGDGREGRPRWQDYFDLIVVEADKPAFYSPRSRGRPRSRTLHALHERPPIYQGGNGQALEQALGFRGDQILYFGDHTYGDILSSKKNLGWRTAMVVQELSRELSVTESIQRELEILAESARQREGLETQLGILEREEARLARTRLGASGSHPAGQERLTGRLTFLERERARLVTELAELGEEYETLEGRCDMAYNARWGPLFRAGKETSRFGHQVKDFACIYMSRVSCLLHYPANHYFQSPVDLMPHEL